MLEQLKQQLLAALAWLTAAQKPPTPPVVPPEPSNTPVTTKDLLIEFCTALRDFEGNPGDLNYKNNNPGNTRCSQVGYLPKYGNVKCVNGFAVFPTYELGWEYLQALVQQRVRNHRNWDFYDFFSVFAPRGDNNNPVTYAKYVANRCGVEPTVVLSNIIKTT